MASKNCSCCLESRQKKKLPPQKLVSFSIAEIEQGQKSKLFKKAHVLWLCPAGCDGDLYDILTKKELEQSGKGDN